MNQSSCRRLGLAWAGVGQFAVLAMVLSCVLGGLAWSAPALAQVTGDAVTLELRRLGVGGLARQGDWCGVEVVFRDDTDTPREVVVEASLTDADGDLASYRRAVTSNPGLDQRVWLYLRLPYGFDNQSTLSLAVYEAGDAIADRARARSGLTFSTGELLVSGRFGVDGAGRVQRYAASGLVVGSPAGGIRGYSERDPRMQGEYRAGGHELIEFAMDVSPTDLSDRWVGLAGFETLVWTDADPTLLSPERASAVAAWVRRGGHLVLCLPANAQLWGGGAAASNPISELMPDVTIERREGQALDEIRGLLSADPDASFPAGVSAYTLGVSANASESDAMRILNWPDGEPMVVRKIVGTGMVTVVGLDVSSRRLRDRGLPETERFWHRILGHRGPVYRGVFPDELRTREAAVMDQSIVGEINFEGSAARGVLVGVVVFALYWVIAGPGGFGLLKKFHLERHSWVAFAAACAVFTGLAWGVAGLLKPGAVRARHVTVLDMVDGTGEQRSRTWASVLVPWYGDVSLGVASGASADPGSRDGGGDTLISVWGPPTGFATGSGAFPDSRAYGVSGRVADRVTTPARSTVKQLQAEYVGELQWSPPVALDPDGGRGEIRVDSRGVPSGLVRHNLPGAITRVHIAVIKPQRRIGSDLTSGLVSDGNIWALPVRTAWQPGTPLDLGAVVSQQGVGSTGRVNVAEASLDRFLLNLAKSISPSIPGQAGPGGVRSMLDSMFIPILEPPVGTSSRQVTRYGVREATHGLGLNGWFTQPCVIITGLLDADEASKDACPTPLRVFRGGRWQELESTGQTVVRWVYPLPAAGPGYFGVDNEDAEAGSDGLGAEAEPVPADAVEPDVGTVDGSGDDAGSGVSDG